MFSLRIVASLLLVGSTLTAAGCSGSLVHEKPRSARLNQDVTEMWARDIRRVARSGDWILTRSYSKTGDAIVGMTAGESFSHAVVYDAERGTIIEAIRPHVREVPLESLLARNRYAVVVRPVGASEQSGRETVARARSVLGANFDYRGMFGFDDETRFYCSELVAWASRLEHDHLVVTPADLYEEAEVIYLSGARDEREVQMAAQAIAEPPFSRVASR